MKTLITTWTGRFIIAAVLLIVGGLFSEFGVLGGMIYDPGAEWRTGIFNWIFYVGLVLFVGQALLWMVLALIINIRNKKK